MLKVEGVRAGYGGGTVLDDSFDARIGLHSEAGPLGFGQLLKKVADHNSHHLEQAKAAIEGRTWSRTK